MPERARPLSEYHEDMGPVLWWAFPVAEPPYVGTPNDVASAAISVCVYVNGKQINECQPEVGGWPGYHTHWTPLPEVPIVDGGPSR